jgi:ankyrin repeat protein
VKTLHWIIYADHDYIAGDGSSLTTEMLLQALAVRDGEEFFEQSSMTSEEELLHWCSSLVRRSRSGYLELAHFTVKEFLQTIDPVQKPHFRQYCLSGDHTILAKACLSFVQCPQFAGYLMMDYDGGKCTSTNKSIRYACKNWSYHVHNSSWDDVQGDVNRFFDMENTFSCGEVFWDSCHMPRDQFISKYLAHTQAPSPLHWAALFGLDKLCARLLQSRMNPSRQSSMGTPLFCAMLSRSVLCDQIEGSIQSDRSWQPQARQSVIHQLLNAGLDLNLPVDEEGQCRPLTVALKLESCPGGNADVFIVSMLVDAGARFSDEDFAILRTKIKYLYDDNRLDELDPCADYELCGISTSRLIKAATRKSWKRLMRGAEFEFFSFVLEIVSYGWPLETFRPFLHVDFKTLFPESNGAELGKLLSDETTDWISRLLHVLSDAISFSAASADEATSSRQRALLYAVSAVNASFVSLLFTLDGNLDASYQDMKVGYTLLHLALHKEDKLKDGRGAEVAKILILNGADVMLRDIGGITCIELAAANGCTVDHFKLLWESALRAGAFHKPNKVIGEIIDALSWSYSRNEPVLDFLWQEFFQSTTLPDNAVRAVAVEQDTTLLLEKLIDNVKNQNLSNERASDNDMGDDGDYKDPSSNNDGSGTRLKGPDHEMENADGRSREP